MCYCGRYIMYKSVDKFSSQFIHNFCPVPDCSVHFRTIATSQLHNFSRCAGLFRSYLWPCVLCEWYTVSARSCGDVNFWVIVCLISKQPRHNREICSDSYSKVSATLSWSQSNSNYERALNTEQGSQFRKGSCRSHVAQYGGQVHKNTDAVQFCWNAHYQHSVQRSGPIQY
jgi:hypothetical protein